MCDSSVLALLNATQPLLNGPAVPSNEWLRDLRGGQGLLPGPTAWPANISFLQAITELLGPSFKKGNVSLGVNHEHAYAVEIGAGDGKRLDGYHRPLDPMWPLFESGFGGLAIESNPVYNHLHDSKPDDEPPITYAAGKLSTALASVNASGNLHIAWEHATPTNVADLLRTYGTPQSFAALNVDVDGDELPLIEAILSAGFSPATVALTINPDIPPPIQLRTRLIQPTKAGRSLVGAEERCDTWPCSTSDLARLRAAGLSGPSADAAFHSLHKAGYELLGFNFGRFSSWCLRCEHRMWWARADVLSSWSTAGVRTDLPTAYRQMVASYWAQVHGALQGPRSFPGKLLAHSSNWVHWRKVLDEEEAVVVAAAAWGETLLGQMMPSRGTHSEAQASPPQNATLKGWCLKADPCPLHAFTHAPPWGLPSLTRVLNCTLPEVQPAFQPETRWLKGSFHLSSYLPTRFAMVSEHLADAAAQHGLCAFASEWVRSAYKRACPSDGIACARKLQTLLAVTQLQHEDIQQGEEPRVKLKRVQQLHSAVCE